MNFKKSALMLSFAAAMTLLNSAAFAIDMTSSQIIKTTGKVSVKKTGNPDFKKVNSNLKLAGSLKNLNGGDKVRTFNNSTADLALKDTCILMVKEQSIFEVPQALSQKDLKAIKAQQGSILFKVAKGSNFQVQTADVICGVKGTMFSVTIADGLHTMLETPGMQLGYATAGGSSIDVYEGEVEVTHKRTNKKISLKPGQGAFLSGDTNDIIELTFDPRSKLRNIYGDIADSVFNAKAIKDLTDIKVIGNYKSKILYDNEVVKKINKIDSPELFKNNKYGISQYEIKDTAKDMTTIFSKGKQYKADFSKYSILDSEKNFNSNSFGEVYLGQATLAACKSSNSSYPFIAEPGQNGLVIIQGSGLVKMDMFNKSVGVDNELLANIKEKDNKVITSIRNSKNNLWWREPGTLELHKVPTGDVAFIYDRNTCKGTWSNAEQDSFPEELSSYNFSVINSMKQEKKQVEKQNKEKKKEALKKTANKVTNIFNKSGKRGKFRF